MVEVTQEEYDVLYDRFQRLEIQYTKLAVRVGDLEDMLSDAYEALKPINHNS